MDTDIDKIHEYNLNLEENRTAIYEQQQRDYSQEFKKYIELFRRISQREDGTKVLRIDSLKDLTPDIIKQLERSRTADYIHIRKYDKDVITSSINGESIDTPISESTYTLDEIKQCLVKLDELTGDLKGNNGLSQSEKVIIVAKRICDGLVYDRDLIQKENKGIANKQDITRGRNLTGALIDGKVVCTGYSDLFYHAMEQLDIPVRDIGALVCKNGEIISAHAFNQVKIDNAWYAVDLTGLDEVHGGNIVKNIDGQKVELSRFILSGNKDYHNVSETKLQSEIQKNNQSFMDNMFKTDSRGAFSKTLSNEDVMKSHGDEYLIPIYATKGENIETIADDSYEIEQKNISNIARYDNSLKLSKAAEKIKKFDIRKRLIQLLYKDKNDTLALPEPEKVLENKEETSMADSKTNVFKESLRVSKEQLKPIEKNEIEDNQIQKDDFER